MTSDSPSRARTRWFHTWLDFLRQDARYALRGLKRSRGFTATVVLTLGLGIGANAAMFGVVDRLMFRPFPYLRDPSRVNRLYMQTTYRGKVHTTSLMSYTRYLDLRRFSHTLSDYAAFAQAPLAVGSGQASREREVGGVSATFFGFFNAVPEVGRFFDAAEDVAPLGAPVAVLSHALWISEFGSRNVIGQRLQVGTIIYEIIGVAPPGFVGAAQHPFETAEVEEPPPAVWIPITTLPAAEGATWATGNYYNAYNWDWMGVLVRRRPGVTLATATTDLTAAFRQSREVQRPQNPLMNPDSLARPRAIAGSLRSAAGPDEGLQARTLLWVTGVAVIVLLIACANVANLMFARVLRRRREMALRLALGVTRRRLIGMLVTEGVMLAGFGCIAGLLVAEWGGATLRRLVLTDGSSAGVLTDWRTLGVAAAVALSAGVFTAAGPALFSIRTDLTGSLKSGVREGTFHRSRTRSALLILQAALSVILLVGAGLFVRSLKNVRAMRLGYDAAPVLVAVANYRGLQMDSAASVLAHRRLLAAAQTIPGVSFAAAVNSIPFSTTTLALYVSGIDSVQRLGRFNLQRATPDYFKVMDTRIVRGRPFTGADREGMPLVAVVSESMGRALWPGKDPIGQCMHFDTPVSPCTTVIGIAEDAVQQNMSDDQKLMYYLSYDQSMPGGGNQIFLRVAGRSATAMVETVRRAMQKAMPGQGYVTVQPLEDVVDLQRRSWKLGATMFVAFGALALAVAAVGLYGVITYNVAHRTQELGVRIALGAQWRDIVRLVVGQAISFAASGVAIGVALALAASRWIEPLLYKESAKDPLTYGAVSALLMMVALLASALPALRAARADPNTALRSD